MISSSNINIKDPLKSLADDNGQTFMEFLFLLLVLLMLSFGSLYGINSNIAERWRSLVIIISSPNVSEPDTSIKLR